MKRRWKLNMLYPGGRMCAASGILALVALVAYIAGLRAVAGIVAGIAALIFAALLVLVKIELYQDRRDNERYIEENHKNGVL